MYRTQVKDIQVGDFVKFNSVKKSTGGVIFRVTEVQPPVAPKDIKKTKVVTREYYDYHAGKRRKVGETVVLTETVFLDEKGKKLPKAAHCGYIRIVPALEVFPAPGYSIPKAGMLVTQNDMNAWQTKVEVISTIELLTTFQTYQRFINMYVTHINQSFEAENKSDTTES